MTSPKTAGKRLFAVSVIIFTLTCIGAVIVLRSRTAGDNPQQQMPTQQANVASSAIAADLTQLPRATPLAGELAAKIDDLEALMKACPDYTSERRSQIAQHIAWLRQPSTLPEKMIIALGGNETEGLLRGIATYTLSDWGLKDQAQTSCLLPIGHQVNTLLVTAGGEAIPAFEGVAE